MRSGAGELVPVFARSAWAEEILSQRIQFGQGITGWAVAHRSPVLANDAHLDPRVEFVAGTPPDPEALITVPLIARGQLKGALNIYRVGEDATFDEDDFELARWFGDAAALALDNAEIRARLEHLAHTDSLTGLYNHRYFHERLRAELHRAGRAHDTVALLMLDIDDFKRVNDVCGHGEGDQVLQFARRGAAGRRPRLRHGLPRRRRGVRRDSAVVHVRRRARARRAAARRRCCRARPSRSARSRSRSASPSGPSTR